MRNELQLLIESLEKKVQILQQILSISKNQYELAGEEEFQPDEFDKLVDEKDDLLKDMERLDEGFDRTYQRIRDELPDKKELYREEIGSLQELIKQTVDLGAQIQASEARAKDRMSGAIFRIRQEFNQRKTTARTVSDYYKTSNNIKYVDSIFLDKKK